MKRYHKLYESSLDFLRGMLSASAWKKLNAIIDNYPELEDDLLELIADTTANTLTISKTRNDLPVEFYESRKTGRMRKLNENR